MADSLTQQHRTTILQLKKKKEFTSEMIKFHWKKKKNPKYVKPKVEDLQEEIAIATDLWGDFFTLVLKTDSNCMKDLNHSNCKVKLKDKEIFLF